MGSGFANSFVINTPSHQTIEIDINLNFDLSHKAISTKCFKLHFKVTLEKFFRSMKIRIFFQNVLVSYRCNINLAQNSCNLRKDIILLVIGMLHSKIWGQQLRFY